MSLSIIASFYTMEIALTSAMNPSQKSWTIRQALDWASRCLKAVDLNDHRLSAEMLLGSVLTLDRLEILLAIDRGLQEKEQHLFQEKVFRRAGHEPAAYLVGRKEFWSLDFEVNPSVLIPRPETELLVEEGLQILSQTSRPLTVVELGTGSGAVAVSLTKSAPQSTIGRFLATDLSLLALQTARKNAHRNRLEHPISFILGDWLAPFSGNPPWIDLLLTNPPYISDGDMAQLPTTVKDYEPIKALSGGPDGLGAIRTIFEQASRHLKKGGWLVMEIGDTQGPQVMTLAQDYFFNPAVIRRDYAGKDRILKACYHG